MISLAEDQWIDGIRTKPAISVLEVRDKNAPDSSPIIWVYLERVEKHRKDYETGAIRDASIQISYQLIHCKNRFRDFKASGFFGGSYSAWGNEISLTSTTIGPGAVFLDLPKGQRIGTYLMNEIVCWAKKWPDANIREIELIKGQADEENKTRRNRFYEQFAIEFQYSDIDKKAGKSVLMTAGQLISVNTWKQNIVELNPVKFAFTQIERLEDLESDFFSLARSNAELRCELANANANPFFWGCKTFLKKNYRLIFWLLLLSLATIKGWNDLKLTHFFQRL